MNGHWLCFFAFFHVTKPSWNPPEQVTASGVINHLVIIFVSDNFTCLHFGQVDRLSGTEMVDSGSIPSQIKPNTIKYCYN